MLKSTLIAGVKSARNIAIRRLPLITYNYSTSRSEVALCLPGQGFQAPGMLADFHKQYTSIIDPVLEEVDESLGFSLSKLLLSSGTDQSTINLTSNAQPLLLTTSYAIYKVLTSLGLLGEESPIDVKYIFGHSLGEYSAWTIAGVLSLSDAVWLVRQRGKAMERAYIECGEPTGMTAILIPKGQYGTIYPLIQRLVSEKPDTLSIANINSTGQTVVAGLKNHITWLSGHLNDAMGKRIRTRELNVSGAFHSPIMIPGKSTMEGILNGDFDRKVALQWPAADSSLKIISNITAKPFESLNEVKNSIVNTLTTPVDWLGSVQYISRQPELKGLLCLGPGKVARVSEGDCKLPVIYVDTVADMAISQIKF